MLYSITEEYNPLVGSNIVGRLFETLSRETLLFAKSVGIADLFFGLCL